MRKIRLVVGTLSTILLAASPPPISQSGLLLQSAANPTLALRVADGFVPLDPITLSLESTDVDRRVFVEADGTHRVKRLIVVQFEHVRPGASLKFVYPPKPPFVFGGETYRLGTYIYDDDKDSAANPNRESGVMRRALTSQGYDLPNLFRTARLARVASADGSSEIIIFYDESADSQYPDRRLPGADEDGDLVLTGTESKALLERMSAALSVVSTP